MLQSNIATDFSFNPNFDTDLEKLMDHEAQESVSAARTLTSHPIHEYLLDSEGRTDNAIGKVIYPALGAAMNATLKTRLRSIHLMVDRRITQAHWQKICENHPASGDVMAEIREIFETGSVKATNDLMDQLEDQGYTVAYHRGTKQLIIGFPASQVDDSKRLANFKDGKNAQLIDQVNGVSVTNPTGGWAAEERVDSPDTYFWSFKVDV